MVLLMDKIYKLREERNAFKDELAFLRHTQKEQSKMSRCEDVGTNTAEMTNL